MHQQCAISARRVLHAPAGLLAAAPGRSIVHLEPGARVHDDDNWSLSTLEASHSDSLTISCESSALIQMSLTTLARDEPAAPSQGKSSHHRKDGARHEPALIHVLFIEEVQSYQWLETPAGPLMHKRAHPLRGAPRVCHRKRLREMASEACMSHLAALRNVVSQVYRSSRKIGITTALLETKRAHRQTDC